MGKDPWLLCAHSYNIMEEKRCKICGKKYIVFGLDILERCISCIDDLEIEKPKKWWEFWRL